MSILDRSGVRLYYEVYGSGPAVLLTHGFGATSRMWAGQVEALARDHTVVLWDMRGHGQSDSPDTPAAYGEAQTIGDIVALLDHLGFDAAVIGGQSLGGFMSMAVALAYPSRLRGLLLVDTGPGYKSDDKRDDWNAMALRYADAIAKKGLAVFAKASREMRPGEHDNLRGLELAARHALPQYSAQVLEGLPRIKVPTLVIVGERDRLYLGASDYMTEKIPNATKVVLEDAGHAANVDQPEAFDDALRRFLDSHDL